MLILTKNVIWNVFRFCFHFSFEMTVTNEFWTVFFFLLKRSDWVFTYELLCKEISFSDERIISFYEKSTWFFDCQSYVQIEMAKYWTMNEQFKMRIDWLLFSFIQFVTNIVNSLSICLAISISTLYVARYQDTTGRKSNEHSTYTHTHTHPYVCASWKRQNKLLELKCRCALFELQSTTIGILYRYSIHIIHNAHTYIDDDVCKLCTKKKLLTFYEKSIFVAMILRK